MEIDSLQSDANKAGRERMILFPVAIRMIGDESDREFMKTLYMENR